MMIQQDSEEQAVQRRRPFNVSSKRFSTPAACVNVCPGPGVYTGDAATAWQYGSLGRKGFGAMCSSSKRLAVRLQYTGPGPARAAAEVPAVGSYDVVSVGAISSSHQRRLAENRSGSPGHPAGVLPRADAALAGAPGPAFYRPGLLPVKTSHRRATSPEAAAAFLAAV
ncbi:hypothetical protein OEZ86_000068 [Tetradesmus obliquus]|nr:hypothetical protein OEZ86_000068 [Tetradesmus obliquus]